MPGRSHMPAQKNFAVNPNVSKPRSVFNRSHSHKTTFDVDYIVPFYADEILPGDSQDLRANLFCRVASPLDYPVMDNLHLDTFYFFVPNRILWDNWEKFMGAQDDPGDSIDFTVPQVTGAAGGDGEQTLSDYLGCPPGVQYSTAAFWQRAYWMIWNEFFRDENLQDSHTVDTDDGPDLSTDYGLAKRGKRHDYFTSCLPTPQKGDAVEIALGTTAPVIGDGYALGLWDSATEFGLWENGANLAADTAAVGIAAGTGITYAGSPNNTAAVGVSEDPTKSHIYADLSSANAATINDLRLAIATQQLLELDQRGGTRYFEILRAHFGIVSPDARLDRPEYLGGSSQMFNVNQVAQTSATVSGQSAQGTLTAYSTAGSRSGYSKSFVEHGVVLGLVNVRADVTYQQGIERMYMRQDRYDFYFPTFANLGEQAVLQGEIFADGTSNDDIVFGYNEMWSEMRYKPSRISGYFRSDSAYPIDSWHLAQDFATAPTLNDAFITEAVPIHRIMAIHSGGETENVPDFLLDTFIELRHARCMPVYSIPGLKRL